MVEQCFMSASKIPKPQIDMSFSSQDTAYPDFRLLITRERFEISTRGLQIQILRLRFLEKTWVFLKKECQI